LDDDIAMEDYFHEDEVDSIITYNGATNKNLKHTKDADVSDKLVSLGNATNRDNTKSHFGHLGEYLLSLDKQDEVMPELCCNLEGGVKSILTKALDRISKKDPRFNYILHGTGSYFDGVKLTIICTNCNMKITKSKTLF
jgi:hypothetical protein